MSGPLCLLNDLWQQERVAHPRDLKRSPMADNNMDKAFTRLGTVGRQGPQALHVAGVMWEELWREAVGRAERAEWLFDRIEEWSTDRGLSSDVSQAAKHWDARCCRRPAVEVEPGNR
jgi:hypothetical protein